MIRISIALMAGLLISSALAMWLAYAADFDALKTLRPLVLEDGSRQVSGWSFHAPGARRIRIAAMIGRRDFPKETVPDWVEVPEAFPTNVSVVVTASGWPLYSFVYRVEIYSDQFTEFATLTSPGIRVGDSPQSESFLRYRAIPFQPIWPGLLGNTLTFAAVFWLIPVTFSMMRKQWRRRRGRCIHCGYDLRSGSSTICPECGPTHAAPISA